MPTLSFPKPLAGSKPLKLSLLFLFLPLFFYGQSLTGLWTGALHNDSTTVRRDQLFEIALTEYNGKVYGYSRSEFIVNDTLYYIVKRVKGTITGDICEVTDDEIVSYNFRGRLDKGIRVTSTFRRNESDSTWYLDGSWKTNATKKYYSITGKVNLAEEKDLAVSKLFPHLEELNLANDVAFYKERTQAPPVVKIAKPERFNTSYTIKTALETPSSEAVAVSARPATPIPPSEPEPGPAVNKTGVSPDRTSVNSPSAAATTAAPVASASPALTQKKNTQLTPAAEVAVTEADSKNVAASNPVAENTTATAATAPVTAPPVTAGPALTQKKNAPLTPVTERPVAETQGHTDAAGSTASEKTMPSAAELVRRNAQKPANTSTPANNNSVANGTPVNKPAEATSVVAPVAAQPKNAVTEIRKPVTDVVEKAKVIGGRKSEFSQVVNFKADSLVISLYDNGEIDGDTVSVFLNGEVLLSHQGLKSSAIKKTIYITPGQQEDFTLVMFAESLGKYPPNTGLLVVRDGDDVYNIRFSSDLQKSSGVIFRRKK